MLFFRVTNLLIIFFLRYILYSRDISCNKWVSGTRMRAYLHILYINRRSSYDPKIHDVVHTTQHNQGGRTMLALYVFNN